MKTKPILFSTPMVKAILEGRKTQTRRIVKSIPNDTFQIWFDGGEWIVQNKNGQCWTKKLKPRYHKNDILWVRETFQHTKCLNLHPSDDNYGYIYKSDDQPWEDYENWKWKPSIFMPKEAARIFIKVINVHVQRLQDISESDAIAEGIIIEKTPFIEPANAFASLWQSINGKKSWAQNPFVWVYEFERTEKPENFI